MDTKGKNIEITAPETITMNAKNININAQEKVEITGDEIKENAVSNLIEFAKTKKTSINEDFLLVSKTIKESADIVDIYSQKENMTLYSKKNVETKSGSKKIKLS